MPRNFRLVVALFLCALARTASAEEAPASAPAAAPLAPGPTAPAAEAVSPETALQLSGGLTAAGAALGLAGVVLASRDDGTAQFGAGLGVIGTTLFVVGPGVGHAYSGRWDRAAWGVGLRALAPPAASLAAVAISRATRDPDAECGDLGCDLAPLVFGFGAGALVSAASAAFDVATAPKSARESEERRGEREAARLSVAPLLRPGASALGLSLAGSF